MSQNANIATWDTSGLYTGGRIMEKTINIGNKSVRLSNNVSWTMEYRDQFGQDIIPTLMPALNKSARIACEMACTACFEAQYTAPFS